jgi:hypothetical protein
MLPVRKTKRKRKRKRRKCRPCRLLANDNYSLEEEVVVVAQAEVDAGACHLDLPTNSRSSRSLHVLPPSRPPPTRKRRPET